MNRVKNTFIAEVFQIEDFLHFNLMMAEKILADKYRKIMEIGQGAYGKIDLAEVVATNSEDKEEGESNDRYVALKKLYIDVTLNDADRLGDRCGFYSGDKNTEGY